MGSAVSCSASQPNELKIQREWSIEFGMLLIHKEEVGKLLKVFCKLNDGEEFVSYTKVLVEVGMDQTLFTSKVFLEHCDKIGNMNFFQFVVAIWDFCSLNFEMLARYVFDLYDFDKKRFIHLDRINALLTDIYDQKTNSHQITQRIMRELRETHPAKKPIDLHEFIKISQTHYELLLPAYIVQTQMRRLLLGLKFWNHAMKQRAVISANQCLPVSEYLQQIRKMNKSAQAQYRLKSLGDSSNSVAASAETLGRKSGAVADVGTFSGRTAATADSRSLKQLEEPLVVLPTTAVAETDSSAIRARVPAKSSRKSETKAFVLDLGSASLRNRRLHIDG